MGEAAFDAPAGGDGDAVIADITGNAGAAFDDQLARADRSFDQSRQAGGAGGDMALDPAVRPLHQRGAADIALDRAIDMQVCRCGDIAGDGDIGPQQ